jgi:hypothetical protein
VTLLTPGLWTVPFGYLVQLALGGIAGVTVFWGLATLLRIPEMSTVSKLLRRIFGRLVPGRA